MAQAAQISVAPHASGTDQRTENNDIFAAIVSSHSGAARPAYLPADGLWVQDTGGATVTWYFFDGTDDISIGTFNKTSNVFTPSGQLAVFANAVQAKSGGFTAALGDYAQVFEVDATSGAITAAIDTTATLNTGWYCIIKKKDSSANAVTVDPAGTDTINGSTTLTLANQHDAVIVIKSGASTFIGLYMPKGGTAASANTGTSGHTLGFLDTANTHSAAQAFASGDWGCAVTGASGRTSFTGAAKMGLLLAGATGVTEYSGVDFTYSGSLTIPLARIAMIATGSGSRLFFGTSNIYANGVTNNGTFLDENGNFNVVTQSSSDNSTKAASTAMVQAALAGAASVKVIRHQVFTATGTYTPNANMLYCVVEVVGGGGGSSNGTNPYGGGAGGGAGGYSRKTISAATIGASKAVTIGAGGSANTGGGGTTSMSTLIQATGGTSGTAIGTEGAGGVGSLGDFNTTGGDGCPGSPGSSGNLIVGSCGIGGASYFGGGSGQRAAQCFGAGAGGRYNTGFAGKAGVVLVTEYCSA